MKQKNNLAAVIQARHSSAPQWSLMTPCSPILLISLIASPLHQFPFGAVLFHLPTLKNHYPLRGHFWLSSNSLRSPHRNRVKIQSHDDHRYADDDQNSTTAQFFPLSLRLIFQIIDSITAIAFHMEYSQSQPHCFLPITYSVSNTLSINQ